MENQKILIKKNSFQRMGLYIYLDSALEFVEFMSDTLTKEKDNVKKAIKKEFTDLDNNSEQYGKDELEWVQANLADIMGERKHNIHTVFPEIQWKTQFIFAMSIFEKSLNDLCELTEVHHTLDVTYKDFKGVGIGRCKTYLSKIFNIEKIFSEKEWQNIQKYRKIRNVLVHANGSLSEQTKENINAAKSLSKDYRSFNIRLNGEILKPDNENFKDGVITINDDFVIDILKNLRKFIFNMCNQKIQF